MEKTGSNRSNMGEEGRGAEKDSGESGKPKRSRPKRLSRKALEMSQSPKVQHHKGFWQCGKEGRVRE